MNKLFECKARYEKVDEKSGVQKKTTEVYLVDALSHGEAETRMYKELENIVSGDFTVVGVVPKNYTDHFHNVEGDRYFKSKVVFSALDELSGKEKTVSNQMLVFGYDIQSALDNLNTSLAGMTVDFTIAKLEESSIVDFFPYIEMKAISDENTKEESDEASE